MPAFEMMEDAPVRLSPVGKVLAPEFEILATSQMYREVGASDGGSQLALIISVQSGCQLKEGERIE